MAENDEPAVSRRQFFRGLTGDLLKVVGEVAGLGMEPEPQPVVDLREEDIVVPPEKQQAALDEIFGFLERLGAEEEADVQAERDASAAGERAQGDPTPPDPEEGLAGSGRRPEPAT